MILQVHAIYKTYLYFYAAISYELLGHAAHVYSSNKIPLLRSSLDYFLACSAALPPSIPLPNTATKRPWASTEDLTSSSDSVDFFSPARKSLVNSITRLIDSSLLSPDDDPFVSDSEVSYEPPPLLSPFTRHADTHTPMKDCLLPSPLRIRKPSGEISICGSKADDQDWEPEVLRVNQTPRPRPPPLPLKVVPATRLNIHSSAGRAPVITPQPKPHFCTQSNAVPSMSVRRITKPTKKDPQPIITPARMASITRFNKSIEFLRSQIASSISSVQSQVENITDLQRARRARNMRRSASFWSFSPVKPDEESDHMHDQEQMVDQFGNLCWKESKEQRIARLRAEGWMTVGLRSPRCEWKGAEYYQAYCNAVLDELYLDT